MALETEIKLPIRDGAALRRALRTAGFRPGQRRRETNWLFDDARGRLRRQGLLLRLRRSGGQWLLTGKGRRQGDTRLKIRPEAEMTVADGAGVMAVLAVLEWRPRLVYERQRTLWRSPAWPGLEAAWDETLAGEYLELEGGAAMIRRAAAPLGYGRNDFITASYPELFRAWARRTGHEGTEFRLAAAPHSGRSGRRPARRR